MRQRQRNGKIKIKKVTNGIEVNRIEYQKVSSLDIEQKKSNSNTNNL